MMRRSWAVLATVVLVASIAAVPRGEAATRFHGPAIEARWKADETALLNFWGPLGTAREFGESEPYREAPGGRRNVQYFDKGRMEDSGGSVTSGLLATEMVTGKVQVGNDMFETRTPARVPVAGDPDNTGPTYAEMATLPEFRPKPSGGIDMPYLLYRGGQFVGLSYDTNEQVILVKSDPNGPAFTYMGDPGMKYGAFVFQPFYEFINTLPDGLSRIGYPIRPYFMADVKIGGVTTRVVVQAFERRVLTYNPKNPQASRVEFGNIGQHYHRWRYEQPVMTAASTPTAVATPAATPAAIPTTAATPTVAVTATPDSAARFAATSAAITNSGAATSTAIYASATSRAASSTAFSQTLDATSTASSQQLGATLTAIPAQSNATGTARAASSTAFSRTLDVTSTASSQRLDATLGAISSNGGATIAAISRSGNATQTAISVSGNATLTAIAANPSSGSCPVYVSGYYRNGHYVNGYCRSR